MTTTAEEISPLAVVREFVDVVRSGKDPEAAHRLMAPRVLARQVVSGPPVVLERTPASYADHVREFTRDYGEYELVPGEERATA